MGFDSAVENDGGASYGEVHGSCLGDARLYVNTTKRIWVFGNAPVAKWMDREVLVGLTSVFK